MMPKWQRALILFALALMLAAEFLAAPGAHAQNKVKDPKVVLDLEKQPAANDAKAEAAAKEKGAAHFTAAPPFGQTCSALSSVKEGYRSLDGLASISELIGAPIEVVRVRRYGAPGEKLDRDEARKHILKLLQAEITEEYRYEPWDEAVTTSLVAKIQFFDHTEGVLEQSGNHVCFSDYAGLVWWARIPTQDAK
jgi:hypothetical protein